MELFAIVLSIPVAFVMSMAYCTILARAIRRVERLSSWLYAVSIVLLVGFLGEIVLLSTLGAVGSRAFVGPAFYVAHSVFFFLGTPAPANVLLPAACRSLPPTCPTAPACLEPAHEPHDQAARRRGPAPRFRRLARQVVPG